MKTKFALLVCLALATAAACAQVPGIITYQGRVTSNGTNFTGTGHFRFVLYRPGPVTSLWSHDNSSVGGAMPASDLAIPVANGLFTVSLGDTTVAGMLATIPAAAFTNSEVRLRIWFDDGVSGVAQLAPDQRIASAAYSLMSATVPDASITTLKLAPGVWNATNFPANSIGSAQVADTLALGATNVVGRLDVYRTVAGTPGISIIGSGSQISTYGADGLEQIRLHGVAWGELLLNNSLANNATAVFLSAQGNTGGILQLRNTNGVNRAILEGENLGGTLTLYQADGNTGAILYGNEGAGSGALSLRNTNGSSRLRAYGGPSSGKLEIFNDAGLLNLSAYSYAGEEGVLSVRNSAGNETAYVWGRDADGTGDGQLGLKKANGTETLILQAGESTQGAQINMYQANGARTIQLDAENGASGGGYFGLYENDGTELVNATANGNGALTLRQGDGSAGVGLSANNGTGGGGLTIYRDTGAFAAQLTVDSSAGFLGLANSAGVNRFVGVGANAAGGAALYLYDSTGAATIVLDSDSSNEGRITTEVLTITGGADLSENFDINATKDELQPGMIVSIDPANPGELVLSQQAYDPAVAGVISGAGGVKPGMLMGHAGTKADGKHPVALTGRVYCYVDAAAGGTVKPGDMLTTSPTPGHAMKATDRERAFGTVIGKAMTGLESGKGLVLVLVSLQ